MLAPDIPVWYRFLDKWGFQFTSLYYDCLLGGPELTAEEKKDPLKRMWRANLSKRADAIATTTTHVWIIEVSADPGLRAVGQLQVYQVLWLRDQKIILPEKMVLVCERIDKDILDAASTYGISVFII
jgi:hypothetical protein